MLLNRRNRNGDMADALALLSEFNLDEEASAIAAFG